MVAEEKVIDDVDTPLITGGVFGSGSGVTPELAECLYSHTLL